MNYSISQLDSHVELTRNDLKNEFDTNNRKVRKIVIKWINGSKLQQGFNI